MMTRSFTTAVRTSRPFVPDAIGVRLVGGAAQFVFTMLISATGVPLLSIWYAGFVTLVTLLVPVVLGPAAS
jgi:hypothetical protein